MRAIRRVIATADQELDLVFIVELYSESLIFLKWLLEMDISDVLQISRNKTTKKENSITKENRQFLKRILWPDFLLYEHFKKKLEGQIQFHRGALSADLKAYREGMEFVSNNCSLQLQKRQGLRSSAPILSEESRKLQMCRDALSWYSGERYMSMKYKSN